MTKAVSANDAKNRLGSLLAHVSKEGGEVIVESHGKPKAVIMSIAAFEEYQELREKKRRADALDELRALRDGVRGRNRSLSEEDADALADRVSREIVDELAEDDVIIFDRDQR